MIEDDEDDEDDDAEPVCSSCSGRCCSHGGSGVRQTRRRRGPRARWQEDIGISPPLGVQVPPVEGLAPITGKATVCNVAKSLVVYPGWARRPRLKRDSVEGEQTPRSRGTSRQGGTP